MLKIRRLAIVVVFVILCFYGSVKNKKYYLDSDPEVVLTVRGNRYQIQGRGENYQLLKDYFDLNNSSWTAYPLNGTRQENLFSTGSFVINTSNEGKVILSKELWTSMSFVFLKK